MNHFQLAQGLIVGDFFLVDTYAPDVFSTDVRNFTFNFLDGVSKVGTTFAPFIPFDSFHTFSELPELPFFLILNTKWGPK